MARIKLDLPDKFSFITTISIRITDLNYAGHVGNDTILSLLHEARIQFLQHHGYEEMKLESCGLIMSDVCIEFKTELFYGDIVEASVTAADFTRVGFDLYYKLEKKTDGKKILAAVAKTGMVCYNYDAKKIASVPANVRMKLSA